jgi:chaperonin GroES
MPRTPKLRPVEQPEEHAAGPADRMRLTADRILVKVPDESERRSKAGLLIPATAAHPIRRCVWSSVILTGPEVRTVKAGDEVLFLPQTGLEVEFEGESYLLLRERDVQGISTTERHDRPTGGQYL